MIKGQISLDLLLALIVFFVVVGFLLNYTNDFQNSQENYSKNVNGFPKYIKTYDFVKSIDNMDLNAKISFNSNVGNTNKIILDANNNYVISTNNFVCSNRVCSK